MLLNFINLKVGPINTSKVFYESLIYTKTITLIEKVMTKQLCYSSP